MLRFSYTILLFAAAVAAVVTFAACGRKGEVIPPGTVIPAQVMDLHAEPRENAVILAWSMPTDNTDGSPLTDLAGFEILRADVPEGSEGCPCEFAPVGDVDLALPGEAVVTGKRTAWKDAGAALSYGSRYAYAVRPYNLDGFRGPISNTSYVVFYSPPPAPDDLAATPEDRTVRLTWSVVQAGPEGLAGYNVYRGSKKGFALSSPLNSKPVTGTSYEDAQVENYMEYYYRVTALKGPSMPYSEGPPSGEAAAAPADTIPPQTPYGLQAVPSEDRVLVSWLPSADEDLNGYVLYRMGPSDEGLKQLGGMPTRLFTYEDTDVEPGMTYSYALSGVDDARPPNESPLSETVTVKVPSAGTN